jgi:plastocyanin
MRKLVLMLALLALAPFALGACGGDDDEDEAPAPEPTTQEPAGGDGGDGGDGGAAAASTVSVSADPGGSFAFEQDTLTASAGKVTFEFTNDASLTHDFCIEGGSGDLGCTDQISGDSDTLEVELEPGEYTYYCSVAGHREGGMEGTLTVE